VKDCECHSQDNFVCLDFHNILYIFTVLHIFRKPLKNASSNYGTIDIIGNDLRIVNYSKTNNVFLVCTYIISNKVYITMHTSNYGIKSRRT